MSWGSFLVGVLVGATMLLCAFAAIIARKVRGGDPRLW